ncbi:MAG TPA: hypothetical protein VIK41_15480, partial [Gemmatimonadaceae bacterium]
MLHHGAAHHRRAKVDGAAVEDASPFDSQDHVFEGVKLQNAIDDAIIAELHRVPVGTLQRLGHDRSMADPASHETQDVTGEDGPGKKL